MEINYWIRKTGRTRQFFIFDFCVTQVSYYKSLSSNFRWRLSRNEDICRYIISTYSQLMTQFSFRDFDFLFSTKIEFVELLVYTPPYRRKHDRMDVLCKSVSTLSNRIFNGKGRPPVTRFSRYRSNLKTRENTYVRIYIRAW